MSFAIAAAGTGGHVFPGLAVGEALVRAGVARTDVLFVGGARLESSVYPEAGFPFLEVELRGLARSLDPKNFAIPLVVARAVRRIRVELAARSVGVVLGMGGYVTIPAAFAARRHGAVVMVAEQNAHAGLANRVAGRLAERRFGAFPTTKGLVRAEWVGNPVRDGIARFDRASLRSEAFRYYDLPDDRPVVGVFGGSLGAGAINDAVIDAFGGWTGDPLSIVHLAGEAHGDAVAERTASSDLVWRVAGFERRMDLFYAACDVIVARAGGAVAELTVTGTPSVLVPGGFGSAGHQEANASVLAAAGAARIVRQDQIETLGSTVAEILFDQATLEAMRKAASGLAKPDAADVIARAMMELHG